MKQKYINEWNNITLLIGVGAYYCNNTKLALVSFIFSIIICTYLFYKLIHFILKKDEIEDKAETLINLINQIILSITIIVLYFVARW